MEPLPDWIADLPEVDTPVEGLEGRLMSCPHGQTVFFRATHDLEVPVHSHGPQWGIVVAGQLEFSIGGVERAYGPGDTYSISDGEPHGARIKAGLCVVEVFQEPDRQRPK